MIDVTVLVDLRQNYTGIGILGHTGLTNDHQDEQELICAAVSAPVLNVTDSAKQFTDNAFEADMNEKTGLFKFRFAQGFSSKSKFLMNSLTLDLESIAGVYGKPYIRIRLEEV